MSGGGARRRHKHEEHDEHVNHERWLVSYADMLTVLMALFIVLFALSQVDQLKFAQFKEGLSQGFSPSNVVLSGNKGVNDVDNGQDPMDLKVFTSGDPMQMQDQQQVVEEAMADRERRQSQSDLEAARREVADYREIERRIDAALTQQGNQDQVTYRITSEGLVVGLVADNVFFANASADVEPTGLQVLDAIGPILAGLPNQVAVQGHTNSLPLNGNARYRDNWDLSSARANSVVTRFIGVHHVSDQRLSSTGFGQTRPLYPDDDPRALAGNRRVDLVIASPSSEAVKALLPQVAETTPTDGPAELSTPAQEGGDHTAETQAAGTHTTGAQTTGTQTTGTQTTGAQTTVTHTTETHTTETATGGH